MEGEPEPAGGGPEGVIGGLRALAGDDPAAMAALVKERSRPETDP